MQPSPFPTSRLRVYPIGSAILMGVALVVGGCAAPAILPTIPPAAVAEAPAQAPEARPADRPATVVAPRVSAEHAVLARLAEARADWEGTPYQFGGTTRSGIDCSAFVQRVMAEYLRAGVTRSTATQVREGRELAPSDLRPGDLVFFRTGRRQRHVGIYLSDGRFLHASSSRGVTVDRLDSGFYDRTFWTARRVLTPVHLERIVEAASPPPAPLVAERPTPREDRSADRPPPTNAGVDSALPPGADANGQRRSGW